MAKAKVQIALKTSFSSAGLPSARVKASTPDFFAIASRRMLAVSRNRSRCVWTLICDMGLRAPDARRPEFAEAGMAAAAATSAAVGVATVRVS